MKVIDLLNKIANDEEVPKKIIYDGNLYYLQREKCYRSDDTNDIFESQFIFEDLNNEIEIIEEPQEHKIEKLDQTLNRVDIEEDYYRYIMENRFKINEIIDYLKENK